jgi:hypothetical protein
VNTQLSGYKKNNCIHWAGLIGKALLETGNVSVQVPLAARNGVKDYPVISLSFCTIGYEATIGSKIILFFISLPVSKLGQN